VLKKREKNSRKVASLPHVPVRKHRKDIYRGQNPATKTLSRLIQDTFRGTYSNRAYVTWTPKHKIPQRVMDLALLFQEKKKEKEKGKASS